LHRSSFLPFSPTWRGKKGKVNGARCSAEKNKFVNVVKKQKNKKKEKQGYILLRNIKEAQDTVIKLVWHRNLLRIQDVLAQLL